jgi:hypothetical protein
LGVNNAVAPNDVSLFKPIAENVFATHCVEGRNVDYNRTRNACAKAKGRSDWSNSAAANLECLGIFELYDGTSRTLWAFFATEASSQGRVYRYDGSRDPVRISDVVGHVGAVEFAFNQADLYSAIRYGKYIVFADMAEHTPYCGDFDDATVEKLISSGTEYKFKYLESWQRRIIGAYSDQTNGDLEVRWSNANPTPQSDCTFAAGDALFIPNDDPITGITKMGRNACYIYSRDSIHRLDYFGAYATPFGITNVIAGQGTTNHHSVVDIGKIHYFFNRNLGFCEFMGSHVKPISREIETWIRDIRFAYYGLIMGEFIPYSNEVAWTVPLEGASANNAILYYNRENGTWRREDKTARAISRALFTTDMTWTKLTSDLGFVTWSDMGNLRWVDLFSETDEVTLAAADGKMYISSTEADDTAAWDGYRVEPVMDFGRPNNKDLLEEIWFDISETGSYSLYCYYRNGDTVAECKNASWTALDEVSLDSPDNAVCRITNEMAIQSRFHQIKWGTDAADEPFVVSEIEFKYEPGGLY